MADDEAIRRFDFVTIFPDMVLAGVKEGVVARAVRDHLIAVKAWNPRDFVADAYRAVDDRPYGGGPGMVMKFQPMRDAIRAARSDGGQESLLIYLSPQGRRFDQQAAIRFAACPRIVLVAGRYEGIDERVIEAEPGEEWSIGDYVLSGGELAALVMFDAVVRLLPGVLGDRESALQDSYMAGLLDHPHYTRPEIVDGMKVPDVLLSGDHVSIRRWRLQQSLLRTRERRPDLLESIELDQERLALMNERVEDIKMCY